MNRAFWPNLRLALFIAAGAWMLAGIAIATKHTDWHNVRETLQTWPLKGAVAIGVGAILYLGAHALRVIRLAVMLDDDRISVRSIFIAHFFAAAVSLLIPFKLGELYRVVEIDRVVRMPEANRRQLPASRSGWRPAARAFLVVWSERLLDLITLTAAFAVAIPLASDGFPARWAEFTPAMLVAIIAVIGTLTLFFVIPENIESLKLFLIRRYNAPWTVRLLRTLSSIQVAIDQVPKVLARRAITLLFLTLLIWSMEVGVLMLFLPAAVGTVDTLVVAVTFFFSNLIPSTDSPAAIVGSASPLDINALYPGAVFATLWGAALILFAINLPTRLREARGQQPVDILRMTRAAS